MYKRIIQRAYQLDENHQEIVKILTENGCQVQSLASIGGGCPDLLISFEGTNYLVEIKSEKGKLNQQQEEWISKWQSDVIILRNTTQCILFVASIKDSNNHKLNETPHLVYDYHNN